MSEIERLKKEIQASQAREAVLREALENILWGGMINEWPGDWKKLASEALAQAIRKGGA